MAHLFLCLSISLHSLDQTQKYQLFSLRPILSKHQPLLSLDLGLKRARRHECLRVWFQTVSYLTKKYISLLSYNKGNEISHIYPLIQDNQTDLDAKFAAKNAFKSSLAPKSIKQIEQRGIVNTFEEEYIKRLIREEWRWKNKRIFQLSHSITQLKHHL